MSMDYKDHHHPHEMLNQAHDEYVAAIGRHCDAEVARLLKQKGLRDEFVASGVSAEQLPGETRHHCRVEANAVRARRGVERADLAYRDAEVRWLEWVADGMPVSD